MPFNAFQTTYNDAERILYKGKYYSYFGLSNLEESEVGHGTVRINIKRLRERIKNGTATFSDKEIEKCLKKKKRVSKNFKKYDEKKFKAKRKMEKQKDIENWNLLNSLM